MKCDVMRSCLLALVTLLAPAMSRADLYSAAAAAEKKEYARAFELYRELAEMGQPEAQENLAVMYVNGEGVKRDNVLGYAWAQLASENGGGDAAKGIVAQLAPHLNEAARARVAEIQSKFGKEALENSLLPVHRDRSAVPKPECGIVSVANPADYYPQDARKNGIYGDTLVEHLVFSDGYAHDPRSDHSFPPDVFRVAGRNVSLHNRSRPKLVNGVAVPCSFRIMVKFTVGPGQKDTLKEQIGATRERAKQGDPMAQLAYAVVIENRSDLSEKDDYAIWWYLKAAQAGIPAAQYFVGAQLHSGERSDKDIAKGLLWFNKAASAGNPDAQLALANYYLKKTPDAASLATAVEWFNKAIDGGSRDARFYFAALLATGPDAALRDPARALALSDLAKSDFVMNPIWTEIRAAAYAQSGDFKAAQKEQATAVGIAKRLGWNTDPQAARLAEYKVGRPWTGDLFAFY